MDEIQTGAVGGYLMLCDYTLIESQFWILYLQLL